MSWFKSKGMPAILLLAVVFSGGNATMAAPAPCQLASADPYVDQTGNVCTPPAQPVAVKAAPAAETYGNAGPLLRPRAAMACQIEGRSCLRPIASTLKGEALRKAHVQRALILLRLFKTQEAQAEMERALALRPRTAETLHLAARIVLADFSTEAKVVARAQAHIDDALKLRPSDSNLMSTKAYILHLRGRTDQSLPLLEKAIARDPRNIFARQQRAVELVERNRAKDAVEEYGHLIRLQPDDGDWSAARGQLLLRLGDAKAAVADFDRALTVSPPSFPVYVARATALTVLGAAPEAIGDLTVLIDGTPEGMRFAVGGDQLAKFLTMRGFLHLRLNQPDQAAADIVRAVQQGGKPGVLRLQAYLSGRGMQVPVDGAKSPELHAAILSCLADGDCADNLGLKL